LSNLKKEKEKENKKRVLNVINYRRDSLNLLGQFINEITRSFKKKKKKKKIQETGTVKRGSELVIQFIAIRVKISQTVLLNGGRKEREMSIIW
jgi:hypothetical protein